MRARNALAERQRPDYLAARHGPQQRRRALTTAKGHGRRGHAMHQEHHSSRSTRAADRFTYIRERRQTGARAALLTRHQQPQRTDLPECAQLLIGKPELTIDLSSAGRDQRLRQIANLR